jgi:hypothetical protein
MNVPAVDFFCSAHQFSMLYRREMAREGLREVLFAPVADTLLPSWPITRTPSSRPTSKTHASRAGVCFARRIAKAGRAEIAK